MQLPRPLILFSEACRPLDFMWTRNEERGGVSIAVPGGVVNAGSGLTFVNKCPVGPGGESHSPAQPPFLLAPAVHCPSCRLGENGAGMLVAIL